MFGQDPKALRAVYFEAWSKHKQNKPLSGIEPLLVEVMQQYPEFHELLDKGNSHIAPELEGNPFFKMGLHVAVLEQVQGDRPLGIRTIYQQWVEKVGQRDAERHFINTLAQTLLTAEISGQSIEDAIYLSALSHGLN